MIKKYGLLLFLSVHVFASCQLNNAKNKRDISIPGKGPEWVKSSLLEAGVFEAPNYTFTNEYDEYKVFENIKGLFFNGLDYHGKKTKVFCWYGVPTTLRDGEKAPAVVLVHGGKGTVFPQWVKKWTDKGYIAASVALEGQVPGPKTEYSPLEAGYPIHAYSGPYRKGFFLDLIDENLKDQWFYQAVANIILANSLLRSFPEVDATKTGITGISWGGILTNVVTGIDDRYAFAVPVYGCGFIHETPFYKKQLEAHTLESKQFYLENWEPSLYVPLHKQPTLFVNGTNDGHFSMNSFTKTYEASNAEKYLHVEHEMPHGYKSGWNPEEIYLFADFVTKKENTPLKFEFDSEKNNWRYNTELNDAAAFYTTDTADWSAQNYKWIKTGVKFSVANKTIAAELPQGAVYYFINGINKQGLMYSSPMVKVKNSEHK